MAIPRSHSAPCNSSRVFEIESFGQSGRVYLVTGHNSAPHYRLHHFRSIPSLKRQPQSISLYFFPFPISLSFCLRPYPSFLSPSLSPSPPSLSFPSTFFVLLWSIHKLKLLLLLPNIISVLPSLPPPSLSLPLPLSTSSLLSFAHALFLCKLKIFSLLQGMLAAVLSAC